MTEPTHYKDDEGEAVMVCIIQDTVPADTFDQLTSQGFKYDLVNQIYYKPGYGMDSNTIKAK